MTEQTRNEAWIGDAVLTLFAREWLLPGTERTLPDRHALHELFTSNQFLSAFGEPTAVEAEIGRVYLKAGLAPAFRHIQEKLAERFLRSARNQGLRTAGLPWPGPDGFSERERARPSGTEREP